MHANGDHQAAVAGDHQMGAFPTAGVGSRADPLIMASDGARVALHGPKDVRGLGRLR
jgi:hypothetical protein